LYLHGMKTRTSFPGRILLIVLSLWFLSGLDSMACSIIYYVDPHSGKIYVANNEDYWYDTKAYIQFEPASNGKYSRLWYGWDDFAQGGVNEHGLFFDAASTPRQEIPEGFSNPNGRNVGDEVLAFCKTVTEAINYLEMERIAVSEGHLMFGDGEGNAAVVEWVGGNIRVVRMKGNYLMATNFLLTEPDQNATPCPRYRAMSQRMSQMAAKGEELDMNNVANVLGEAVQPAREDASGRVGGTLYSTFINISDMKMVLVPRLDNSKALTFDLKEEFKGGKRVRIKLQ